MTHRSLINKRGPFYIGQHVRVTERHLKLFPNSKMRGGVLVRFCRGTEVCVDFVGLKMPRPIDERFIEPAPIDERSTPADAITG